MIFPKTERQVSFCEHFIRTGNALQSAKAAGYGTSDESAKRRGTELSKRYKEYIDSEIRQNLGSLVPIALKIVAELAEHGESETVRNGHNRRRWKRHRPTNMCNTSQNLDGA